MTNPRSAKAKGREFQKKIAELIRDALNLSEEHVVSTPASVTGEDIILSQTARDMFPFSIECKKQERLNIWEAIEQSEANNPVPSRYAPLVIFSKNRKGIYVVIPLNTFLAWVRALLWMQK